MNAGPFPLLVLMYHDIGDSVAGVPASDRPYVVGSETFREQLRILDSLSVAGVRLDELLQPGKATGRACVITFDDGHASNYTRALPLLQERRFRATFFITVGWVGTAPYMSWEQLRAMAAAGMEIGSHTVTHRPPVSLGRDELQGEMRDSKRLLEDRLGAPVTSASSPTGFFNPEMIPAAQDAGYRALCYGRVGLWRGPDDAFTIPRVAVKPGTDHDDFRRIVSRDRGYLVRLRAEQMVRNGLKRALGVQGYLRLRRLILERRFRAEEKA